MLKMKRALICFLLSLSVLTPLLCPQESGEKPMQIPAAKEVLLGELSPNTEIPTPEIKRGALRSFLILAEGKAGYIIDPFSLRFAARAKQGDKWVLLVDGKEKGAFDAIESIFMSPYDESVVCSAKQSGKWVKMLDDKQIGQAFDELGEGLWSFNNSGLQHYAYPAKRGAKWLIVADGKEGAEFEEVGAPSFSRERLIYAAKVQKSGEPDKWTMIVGSQKGGEFEEISRAIISADSEHMAYRAKRDRKRELVVLDGKEGREFEEVGSLVFSNDSQHFAYRAKLANKREVVILDGNLGPQFEEVGSPVFSSDSQHLAYRAKRAKKREIVVIDGGTGPEFERVGGDSALIMYFYGGERVAGIALNAGDMANPVYSPDGKHLVYFARKGSKWRVVMDGQGGPEFNAEIFSGPLFTDDSQHVACVVVKGTGKAFELRDGKSGAEVIADFKGRSQSTAFIESPVISPDGQKFAYILGAGGGSFSINETTQANRRVVVNGNVGEKYNCFGMTLHFTSDSRHFIYVVRGGVKGDKSRVITDGNEGKVYDDVLVGNISYDDSSKKQAFVYIAREGRKFYRVTQLLP